MVVLMRVPCVVVGGLGDKHAFAAKWEAKQACGDTEEVAMEPESDGGEAETMGHVTSSHLHGVCRATLSSLVATTGSQESSPQTRTQDDDGAHQGG